MEMNVLAIVLLGLAINGVSFASPIPQCGSPSPPPSSQECYVQNNGQPVVVVANSPVEPGSDSSPLNCASSQNGQSAQSSMGQLQVQSSGQFDLSSVLGSSQGAYSSSQSGSSGNLVAPAAPSSSASSIGSSAFGSDSSPSSGSSSISSSDLQLGQNLADQAAVENPLETLPQSDTPCKVETNTEVENVGGETFVHHPGPIYINQPPTRLIINHPPYVIRPSPIVLNQAGRKVTKEYTKTYLPSPVQVRPIIVRVVKPIEQKVFVDKQSQQSSQSSSGAQIGSQTFSQSSSGAQSGSQTFSQSSSGAQSGSQTFSQSSSGAQSGSQQSNQSSSRAQPGVQSGQWGQQSGQWDQSGQSSAPCLPSSSQGSNSNSLYQDAPIELQSDVSSDNGSSFQQGSSADLASAGCGCAKK